MNLTRFDILCGSKCIKLNEEQAKKYWDKISSIWCNYYLEENLRKRKEYKKKKNLCLILIFFLSILFIIVNVINLIF